MRLTVFGATGGVGGQIVRQALLDGHQVTAVVRDPARLSIEGTSLDVVTANVTDPEALLPALVGRDAVLSGLGPRDRKAAAIAAPATRAILTAMDRGDVRRLVVVSATPVGPDPEGESAATRLLVLPMLRRILRDVYADLTEMEDELRRSAADWTVVRPPRLTDGPLTAGYRRLVGGNVRRARPISRADVAHAMLAALDDPATVKQAVGVAG